MYTYYRRHQSISSVTAPSECFTGKNGKKSKYISRRLKYRWRAYRPVRMGHSGRTVHKEFSPHNVADRGVIQTLWEELAGEVAHRDQLITCLLK